MPDTLIESILNPSPTNLGFISIPRPVFEFGSPQTATTAEPPANGALPVNCPSLPAGPAGPAGP
jgi:hypothetical protein